ncbi:MAG: HAD hydrolase family protein [Neisseriaceae bacterium]|nr:HAD hydrolase family protein [Neisseriaceae bacterium]
MVLKISVYVFDIDGTLTTDGQPISQRVGDGLLDLAQESTLIFASARPIRDMLPMLPVELHHCLMIGATGFWFGNKVNYRPAMI